MLLGIDRENAAVSVDDVERYEIVAGETVGAAEQPESASERVPGDPDRRAASSGECKPAAVERLVDRAQRRTRTDRHHLAAGIQRHVVDLAGVDDDVGALRKSLERVAAAA